MNNIHEFKNDVERMLDEEQRKYNEAANEKALYNELKDEAAKKEKAAKAAMKELELARKHAEKAQESYTADSETVSNETVYVPTEKAVYISEKETTKKSGSGIRGFLVGAAVVLLLTGGYKLVKDSKIGDVKVASTSTVGMTDPIKDTPETRATEPGEIKYDYENNEAVVTDNYEFNYDGNAVVTNDTQYVELTTEKFEILVDETINILKGYGLQVSEENIIKYVMIRNIDKLSQDNKELISTIVGQQDPDEVFADADSVIDAIMTYNLLYFDENHNTDGFISASVGVFDETQKTRVLEIEKRVYELGAYYQDEEKYNELMKALLSDMINPAKEISELEDGVSYGVEWIDMYMVRSTFGTDRYIKLSEENADKIKYFVSFAGDGEEYENNAVVNGNNKNIFALLDDCEKNKTLTK